MPPTPSTVNPVALARALTANRSSASPLAQAQVLSAQRSSSTLTSGRAAGAAIDVPGRATLQVPDIPWSSLALDLSVAPKIGSLGIVFLARYSATRKPVAVKVLRSALTTGAQGPDSGQSLQKEARTLLRASNGGLNLQIVKTHGVAVGPAEGWQAAQPIARAAEVRLKAKEERAAARRASGSDNGDDDEDKDDAAATLAAASDDQMPAPYLVGLVMAYEDGVSLHSALYPRGAGRVAWTSARPDQLRILKEVAEGLRGLHAAGLVHGRLKPDNVLLSSQVVPHVRLVNFDAATSTAEATTSRANRVASLSIDNKGTWPYKAPELYRSPSAPAEAASAASEVYSFGSLAHEVLSGLPPWADSSEPECIKALRAGDNLNISALPAGTPEGMAALVGRCLSLMAAQRPAMAEVLAALEQAYEAALAASTGGGGALPERKAFAPRPASHTHG